MKAKHGGNIYEAAFKYGIDVDEIIDFSANINPLGLPDKLRNAIVSNIDIITKYPEPSYKELIDAIAKYNSVDENYIFPGNGAIEIIFLMIEAISPKKTLLLAPTFIEYERALKKVQSDINYYELKEENEFKVDRQVLLEKIDKEIDLIILCNPNNPTGQIISKEILKEVLEKCKAQNIFLIVDEAFIDFTDKEINMSLTRFVEEFSNLIIIKAFTKFFAIPGLRLGYGITSNKKLKDRIEEICQPWTINGFASMAGRILLEDKEYIDKSKIFFQKERKYLFESLKNIKQLQVFKPEANYIFFKVLKEKVDLKTELIRKKILIRQCDNYVNLDSTYYRIAIKDRKSNEKLIKTLKEVLDEG